MQNDITSSSDNLAKWFTSVESWKRHETDTENKHKEIFCIFWSLVKLERKMCDNGFQLLVYENNKYKHG